MELVPFDEHWAGSETKLDLKGWYRRSSVHGGFSVVGPLPLRRHLDWTKKGLTYITLGSAEDVVPIAKALEAKGVDLAALRKSYDHMGHFKIAQYLSEERVRDATFLTDLQSKVDKYGVEAVTEMMRMQDPGFVMPDGIAEPVAAAKRSAKVS